MNCLKTRITKLAPPERPQHRRRNFPSRVLALVPALCLLSGCNAVILLGYLIHGPPAIEPEFHKKTGKWLSEKGKSVLVLCHAPTSLKWDNDSVDHEVAKVVSYRLNSHDIKTVDPDRVRAWLDKNPNYDKVTEVGAAFKVDYVIHIDLRNYSLFEENSDGLYRGRCDAIVYVWAMQPGTRDGKQIFSTEITSRYPSYAGKSTYEISYDDFKLAYLAALSEDIGRRFYETYAGDEFKNAVLQ
jgi:hypothetical protein